MKVCNICLETKELTEFYGPYQSGRYFPYCKACQQVKESARVRVRTNRTDKPTAQVRKYRTLKKRALEKGIPFALTISEIKALHEETKFCPIFGTPFTKDDPAHYDRLLPHLGYIKSNIRLISGRANRIKSDATLEELTKIQQWLLAELSGD